MSENIKLIIFDFDGVLADVKEVHREAFIKAIGDVANLKISNEYHDKNLCGLSTKEKIKRLGINHSDEINKISEVKQYITFEHFNELRPDYELAVLLNTLRILGYKLACASNCIRDTLTLALKKLQIDTEFDIILSNSDVNHIKPSPEIYYRAMIHQQVWVPNTLIIEDSEIGKQAIKASGCRGLIVKNRQDLRLEKIIWHCLNKT